MPQIVSITKSCRFLVIACDSHQEGKIDLHTSYDTFRLHAMYGKEKYVAGVWCPRVYEDKRFVMLKYFPQFVTDMLMPPIPEPPKYHIFLFSALFAAEITEHPEVVLISLT